MFEIKVMTDDELNKLKQEIELELRKRNKKCRTYLFEFKGHGYKKASYPYCARLVYNGINIEREFVELERTYNKNKVNAIGTFRAAEGDIIEQQIGYTSGKFRYVSIVIDGKLTMIGNAFDPKIMSEVKKYLLGETSRSDFTQYVKKINRMPI